MCQGIAYCGECAEHAHAHGVEDWASGKSHAYPAFGDQAQCRAATMRRRALYEKLKTADPLRALRFPEFNYGAEWREYMHKFAALNRHMFTRIGQLPGFATYVRFHPFVDRDVRGKRRTAKSYNRWQKRIIFNYMREVGLTAIAELHKFCNWPLPWWALPDVEQRLAA